MKRIFAVIAILSFLLQKIKAQPLYFPPLTGTTWNTISPQSLNWCQNRIDSLYKFLGDNNTKAFVLLKDGKIVLEQYFGTHTATTAWQWASAGKTITAFMVGIAQQENKLSINDKTSKYIGQGWTNCTPEQEDKITIWNQLTMTSGLDDGVPDHYCTLKSCLIYKADAGTRWAYHNGPYTMLDSVIEVATGTTLNNFTTQKLKTPTGMTGQFVTIGYNHVFFSTARSMARFGLLMLNNGNWNGTQVMTDATYFNQMINTSQQINKSYGYLWWLNGKSSYMLPGSQFVFNGFMTPNAPADTYSAMGKDGQFLNVVPSQNVVWVRMGEAPDGSLVPYQLNDAIWKYINQFGCTSTYIHDINASNNLIQVFPNPASDYLQINAKTIISKMDIYSLQGQLLKSFEVRSKTGKISLANLPLGQYLLKVQYGYGNRIVRFTKE